MPGQQPSPLKLYAPLPRYVRRRWSWKTAIIIVVTILITAAVVRFYDNIESNHQTNQAVQQEKKYEDQLGKDFSRLLNSSAGPVNCSDFITNFAAQQCQEHDKH